MNTETFICDAASMKYLYNTIPINDVECFLECQPPRCNAFPAGSGITISAPMEATGCSVTATCDTGTQLNVELQDGRIFLANSPQTFTFSFQNICKKEIGKKMRNLWVIRHGERIDKVDPEWIKTAPRGAWDDPPLT
uniref:Uncharacterized protein n=1 Tax=Panagrolaimus superbus TaxID=310955 RepID=A0A914YR04_9BILA